MPSFAAHLIIAQEVFGSLKDPDIEGGKNYFLLGSLGPDLPYYRNVFGPPIKTFFEEKYNPDSPGYYSGLEYLKKLGPYCDAYNGIAENSEEAKQFKKMFEAEETNYLTKYFEPAKEISNKYIMAARTFFRKSQISDNERRTFLTQIPDADLTSPLMTI